MDIDKEKILVDFFNKCDISCEKLADLNNTYIERESLLSDKKYESILDFKPELKAIYSSSYMTSLQKTAKNNQKWPLINILRQILKTCNYTLKPIRKSDGYTKSGKKKYKRFFIIKKIQKHESLHG